MTDHPDPLREAWRAFSDRFMDPAVRDTKNPTHIRDAFAAGWDAALAALSTPPTPSLDEIAETFHDALCTVSHHDRPEVYRAAMGHDQPCRVKFANIVASRRSTP